MNRWAAAFPVLGILAALLVLAPNSLADFPRAMTSLAIAVGVGLVSFGYIWLRSRGTRRRARVLGAIATVSSDPDSLELAAHVGKAEAPRLGSFAVVGTAEGIQLWSSETRMDVAMPWASIRSVDVDPGLTPGGRSVPAISVFTTVSPRVAIRLIPQGRYGVLRPSIEKVGEIVARLREVQPRA